MRLLSTDITKLRKLSLQRVNLPPVAREPEPKVYPPTAEEIAYNRLVNINPLLEALVDSFDLVSNTTGKRIKRINIPHPEPKIKELDKPKLIALAQRVIKGENNYTKDEIIERIKEATNVNQDRAEIGFNLILQAGAIKLILEDRYYLTGSTPF
jgi:hypothetical protein